MSLGHFYYFRGLLNEGATVTFIACVYVRPQLALLSFLGILVDLKYQLKLKMLSFYEAYVCRGQRSPNIWTLVGLRCTGVWKKVVYPSTQNMQILVIVTSIES